MHRSTWSAADLLGLVSRSFLADRSSCCCCGQGDVVQKHRANPGPLIPRVNTVSAPSPRKLLCPTAVAGLSLICLRKAHTLSPLGLLLSCLIAPIPGKHRLSPPQPKANPASSNPRQPPQSKHAFSHAHQPRASTAAPPSRAGGSRRLLHPPAVAALPRSLPPSPP